MAIKLPNNELPLHLQEDVKIVNATQDVEFVDSWGRANPNAGGDIVLGPRKFTYRKKFEAMHWFGDWTKTGRDWEREVERVAKRKALVDPNNPQWRAIKEGLIYVEGYTDKGKVDYKFFSMKKYDDKHPQFSLDGPVDSAQFVRPEAGKVYNLEATVAEAVDNAEVTTFKK